MRPYVTVTKVPNFDPTSLPYWDIYTNEGTADKIKVCVGGIRVALRIIVFFLQSVSNRDSSSVMYHLLFGPLLKIFFDSSKVGGTMAGEFTAGLSGGQRKLFLFELIYQRTMNQKKLLIVLDEPFAGVTDDFVPFIVERLNLMRKKHNILLVTNDHVQTLTNMADNIITVSAIDRKNVKVNSREKVDREKVIAALSVGDDYVYEASNADFKFFVDTELVNNGGIMGVVGFTMFSFVLFLISFWDSSDDSAALVLIAGGIIAYFASKCCALHTKLMNCGTTPFLTL